MHKVFPSKVTGDIRASFELMWMNILYLAVSLFGLGGRAGRSAFCITGRGLVAAAKSRRCRNFGMRVRASVGAPIDMKS